MSGGAKQTHAFLADEAVLGSLNAEEKHFPFEPKRPPECELSVNGNTVSLAAFVATPLTPEQRERAIQHMLDKGYDAKTAAYWIDLPYVPVSEDLEPTPPLQLAAE